MKKLQPRKEDWHYPPAAKLYRDDIDTLINELSRRGFRLMKLEDNEYAFESIEELEVRRGKVVRNLYMEWHHDASGGEISIKIPHWRGTGITVQLWGKDVTEEVRSLVLGIFRARQRWFSKYLKTIVLAPATVLVGLAIQYFHASPAWYVLLAISFAGWIFSVFWENRGSIVDLRHKHDASFWARNSDSIVSGVIASVLSASVGFVAGQMWERWHAADAPVTSQAAKEAGLPSPPPKP